MAASTRSLLLAFAASAVFRSAAGADDEWSHCGAGFQVPARPVFEGIDPGSDPGAIYLSADRGDSVEGGGSVLTGNVEAGQGTLRLRTDELTYTPDGETLDARGNVRIWDKGVYVAGDRAHADTTTDVVTVEPVTSYMLEKEHGHGEAAMLTRFGNERITADDATYTTCNPGDADWRVTASRVELDFVEEFGTARNAWLEFKGARVLYTPWMSFPMSERRKTGFLTPTYGVSGSRGVELIAPYYFNLAPNYDATLTARAMSRRGVQTEGELRFLSRTYGSGRLLAQYLPSDEVFDDDRAAFDFTHRHQWSRRWSTDARVEWASDEEYFADFGTDLSQSSRSHLPQWLRARYRGDGWRADIELQDHLTVDREAKAQERPYAELPQIRIRTDRGEKNRALNFESEAEFTYFDHRSPLLRTTGRRAHLQSSAAYPIRTAGTFVIPKAMLYYTRYDLDRAKAKSSLDDTPSRLLPGFSLDSGLFFERPVTFGDRSLTHTIEPRLYYLRVPFESQNELPDFDTDLLSFSFAQLFRENRFSGRDRLGDADQVTLAVTSRLLDERGGELGRASIGQIRYLRDREVTLASEVTLDSKDDLETARGSDIVAEVEARPTPAWRLRAGLQYDTEEDRSEKHTLSLRYQPDKHRILNATYRFIRDPEPNDDKDDEEIKQADLSFAWPLGTHWRAVGRWNFDLEAQENRTLEAFGGLEYESCCWAFRTVVRRFLTGDDDQEEDRYSTGIFLQIEFKGLTGFGRGAGAFLERSIPGYGGTF